MNVAEHFHGVDVNQVTLKAASLAAKKTVFGTHEYRKAWREIQSLEPIYSDLRLALVWVDKPTGAGQRGEALSMDLGSTDSRQIRVLGLQGNDPEFYAMDFVDWELWLGMEVEMPQDMAAFDRVTIAARILVAMTSSGFSREAIAATKTAVDEKVKAFAATLPGVKLDTFKQEE